MAITLNGTTGPTFDAGQRITGDFSNATIASRTIFQTSTANSNTIVHAIPLGTGSNTAFSAESDSAATNGVYAQIACNAVGAGNPGLVAGQRGTASFPPLTFFTNNTEQMRIATDGTITSALGGMQVRSGTAVASTSGTAIDFTGIPSWAKRITVMFSGVSTNGSSRLIVRIGTSGGIETSSYACGVAGTGTSGNETAGFPVNSDSAAGHIYQGSITINNFTSNTWVASGSIGRSDNANAYVSGGSKTLSGTLDRVRITTVNGTDTFDAGSINILYE